MGNWKVIVPESVTNLVTNPSMETATTGYSGSGGGSISSRSAAAGRRGVYGLIIDPSAGTSGGCYYTLTLSATTQYTFSVDVRGTNGIPFLIDLYDVTAGAIIGSATTFTGTGDWQRPEVTATTGANTNFRLRVLKNNSADVNTFDVDGFQCEAKGYSTTFCDGDQPGCRWTGQKHASTSTRSGKSKAGGRVRDLYDTYSFKVNQMLGAGVPPINTIATPYGLLPGSLFQQQVAQQSVFTLTGELKGSSLSNLHSLRDALWDGFKPDAVPKQQPTVIQYVGAGNTKELDVFYDAGLGLGDVGVGLYEKLAVRLLATDPFWKVVGEKSQVLAVLSTDANANYIVQRGLDGDWDALGTGMNGSVDDILMDGTGKLYVAGNFTTANGVTVNYVTYWNGTTFTAMGVTGVDVEALTLAIGPNGTDVYVGGFFTLAGGVANTAYVAKWNGSAWSALGTGMDNIVYSLAVDSSGNLYAGGLFALAGGVANTSRIAKWNGTAWSALSTGISGGTVLAVAVGLDGTLYAGGSFTTAGGTAIPYIAQWDGTTWTSLGSGVNANVRALTIAPDGSLYVGGNFTTAGSDTANYIARWDGSNWSRLGDGMNNSVFKIRVASNGHVYASGDFTTAGGLTLPDRVARWNGFVWLPIDTDLPGAPTVAGINVDSQGLVTLGYSTSGTVTSGALTTTTNNGGVDAYPRLEIDGPGALYQLVNFYEDEKGNQGALAVYFNLTILTGETVTLDFAPGKKTFTSSFRGNIINSILPGSSLNTWRLFPGANSIVLFVNDATAAARLIWRDRFWSLDGA